MEWSGNENGMEMKNKKRHHGIGLKVDLHLDYDIISRNYKLWLTSLAIKIPISDLRRMTMSRMGFLFIYL